MFATAACSPEPTLEQQIIEVIRVMEAHAEKGERRPFMNYVADPFQGQDGAMNRDDFRVFFTLQLNKYNRLEANLLPISVTDLGEGQAGARFRALVTGGNRNLLPEAGQLYLFKTTWVQEGGDWLLASARWEPVRLGD